jgi:hypothetical protein
MNWDSVFIHIPRTGGVALKWALNNKINNLEYINAQDHSHAIERRRRLGTLWDAVYKFTIIRNPWDRAVSFYHHCGITTPFHEWLMQTDIDQACYFMDNDRVIVDDVFRYETLQNDVPLICERAGWPLLESEFQVVNASIRRPYQSYYTPETRKLIEDSHAAFIERYVYKFE